MSTFPKWGYHPKEAARIFEVEADNPILPEGWFESPADIKEKSTTKDEGPSEEERTAASDGLDGLSREDMIDVAEKAGIDIDKRWGDQKLRDAIKDVIEG